MNTDSLNRTVFIRDNLPFLKALDSESVDRYRLLLAYVVSTAR